MFDFLKPEVSGIKNILNAYFTFKQHLSTVDDIPPERMLEFAQWYFSIRLGPPIFPAHKALQMQERALKTINNVRLSNITLLDILVGLLSAEDMLRGSINYKAIGKVFKKFPSISINISGL